MIITQREDTWPGQWDRWPGLLEPSYHSRDAYHLKKSQGQKLKGGKGWLDLIGTAYQRLRTAG